MTVKPRLTIITCAIALLMATQTAMAQSSRLRPFPVGDGGRAVSISVSYQFFLEGNTQSVADQADLANQGRRHLYKLLSKECEILMVTIASQCSMRRANVNTQLRNNRRNLNREGVRVSGSATYQIQLKPLKVEE